MALYLGVSVGDDGVLARYVISYFDVVNTWKNPFSFCTIALVCFCLQLFLTFLYCLRTLIYHSLLSESYIKIACLLPITLQFNSSFRYLMNIKEYFVFFLVGPQKFLPVLVSIFHIIVILLDVLCYLLSKDT